MFDFTLAAVAGDPVEHSLSPDIFEFLSRRSGVSLIYRKIRVPKKELENALAVARTLPFTGWNITIPHKENITLLLDRLSPEAKALGAVNVLHFVSGRTLGYNTDVMGVTQTLREKRVPLKGRHALMFGAGGAAKAVAYSLGQSRIARLTIVNRSQAKARKLKKQFSALFPKTEFALANSPARVKEPVTLWVNATPCGMTGFAQHSLLPRKPCLPKKAWAFDLVYRPQSTPFLKAAGRKGMVALGGLDMLVWQALGTWELWFGKLNDVKKTKQALSRHLKRKLG